MADKRLDQTTLKIGGLLDGVQGIDGQNTNTIVNLVAPTSGGEPVTLNYFNNNSAGAFTEINKDILATLPGENTLFTLATDIDFQYNGSTNQFSMLNNNGINNINSNWNVTSKINQIVRVNPTQTNIITPPAGGRTYFTGDGAIDTNQALNTDSDSIEFFINLTAPDTVKYNLKFTIILAITTLSITGFSRTRSF